MVSVLKIKQSDVERMVAEGYCRVSRRHLMLSRIDREDWREHMARQHAPWDWKGEGMKWATSNGMDDHYRRCHSKDVVTIHPDCQALFMRFPPSGGGYRGAEQFRPKSRPRPVSIAVADAATARGTVIPEELMPEGYVQRTPDGLPFATEFKPKYRKKSEAPLPPAGPGPREVRGGKVTSESQPDLDTGSKQPQLADVVFIVSAIGLSVWVLTKAAAWLMGRF